MTKGDTPITPIFRLLPETSADLICLEVSGRVILDDYKSVLMSAAEDVLKKYGHCRLFISYTGRFYGWDADAASFDLSVLLEKAPLVKKVALVNPPENVVGRWEKIKPLIGGDVQMFAAAEFDAALEWVRK